MTRREMAQLSGAELKARLTNRGVAPAQAQRLVEGRESNRIAIDEMLRILAHGQDE